MREHVCDTERADFRAALGVANEVRRWLSEGTGCGLPDAALDLRGELERAGLDPRGAVVEVVRLDAAGPGLWDCDGEVLVEVVDAPRAGCDDIDDECDDTVIVVGGCEREGR